jgi:predicted dehydrogenase
MDGPTPWRLDPVQSGGGLIMDVGCLVVDRIDWLCGPIEFVRAEAKRKERGTGVEDYVRFEGLLQQANLTVLPPTDNVYVSCEWDFASEQNLDELTIRASSGSLRMIAMIAAAPIYVLGKADKVKRVVENFNTPQHTAQAMIQAVADDLRGIRKTAFLSKGESALRTSMMLDRALEGYCGNRDDRFGESFDSQVASKVNA